MELRTKPSESTDTSFGGRIKKDLWAEFKAICDDSEVMTSSVLISYIKACVRQKSLITFTESEDRDDRLTDGVNARLTRIEKLLANFDLDTLAKLNERVGKLESGLIGKDDKYDDDDLLVKFDQFENQFDQFENHTVLEMAKNKLITSEKIDTLTSRIETIESSQDIAHNKIMQDINQLHNKINQLANQDNTDDIKQLHNENMQDDNQVSKVDPVAPIQTDDVASEGKEFDLTDYLVRPDPLAVDPTDDDPTDKGKESVLWKDDPTVAKSIELWVEDDGFLSDLKTKGKGTSRSYIYKNWESLGLKKVGKGKYCYNPDDVVVN